MRAAIIVLTLTLATTSLWGQGGGVALSSPRDEVLSRAYLDERVSLLESDGLLSAEEAALWRERYEDLLRHPLDIRIATEDELLSIPLLGTYQVYQLIRYRNEQRHSFTELSDLKLIDGWDEELIAYLYPLLRLSTQESDRHSWNRLMAEGQSRFSLSATRPWSAREYTEGYIGSPESLSLRYRWQSAGRISLSLGADKDSYEPWRYGRHRGFDSYHGHVALSDWGIVRRAVLGQYRVSWAEGLILAQGFRSRSLLPDMSSTERGIVPSSGLSEYGLSQGLGIEVALSSRLLLSALGSWQSRDASLDEEELLARGLAEGGLHRTAKEWERRHALSVRHYGLRLAWQLGRWQLAGQGISYDWGGVALATALGASTRERLRALRRHANASLSYRYVSPSGRITFSGEGGLSSLGAMAQLHRLRVRSETLGEWQLVARYISPDYWAFLGQGQTHYQRPNNEMGLGLGLRPELGIRQLKVELEGDWYRSADIRRRDEIERGAYLRSVLRWADQAPLSALLRFSYRRSNQSPARLGLSLEAKHGAGGWRSNLRIDLAKTNEVESRPWAYALSLRTHYQTSSSWRLWGAVAYHRVQDWSARLYYAEPRLSEQYTSTFLYGQGWRLSLGATGALSRRWSIGLRYVQHQLRAPRPSRRELSAQLIYVSR